MCAIFGEIGIGGSPPSPAIVALMADHLASRRRDTDELYTEEFYTEEFYEEKYYEEEFCAEEFCAEEFCAEEFCAEEFYAEDICILGQRWLREHSSPPWIDREQGLCIVFNGTLTNSQKLRKILRGMGHHFTSDEDTELLVQAYLAWKAGFVERLKGPFTFALWESTSRRMFLGRDRSGIKPMYYCLDPDYFRFASTLSALTATGDFDSDIDSIALNANLTDQGTISTLLTGLRGVRMLPPATLMSVLPDGTLHLGVFGDPAQSTDSVRNA